MTPLLTADFDYDLPDRLIAQTPAADRTASRLMVLHRSDQRIEHRHFSDIGAYLNPGDTLVANQSKVIPARLLAHKQSGGSVELLLLQSTGPDFWQALARPGRRLRPGMTLLVDNTDIEAHLRQRLDEGAWLVEFRGPGDVQARLFAAGSMPLPPYIHSFSGDPSRYQTVYAETEGSVAAPTAGLHFSDSLLANLHDRGIAVEFVTLHVGIGTFRPVKVEDASTHRMHAERAEIASDVAARIGERRAAGGRVIAVGTTTTRLLETAHNGHALLPFQGETDIFIYPGYRFNAIDGLVTNFHLPKSTLLMMISAFAGRDFVMRAYREAVDLEYRFFSFGDAMLIL